MLLFRNRAAFNNFHCVTNMFCVPRIMYLVPLCNAKIFFVFRMLHKAVHCDDHGVLHFIGHNSSANDTASFLIFRFCFHRERNSTIPYLYKILKRRYRATTFVLTGNFVPALRSVSVAASCDKPSTSKSTRPGRTSMQYPCGSPLPFPIPTSGGFAVYGRSGNMRIQILPLLPASRDAKPAKAARFGFAYFLTVRTRRSRPKSVWGRARATRKGTA